MNRSQLVWSGFRSRVGGSRLVVGVVALAVVAALVAGCDPSAPVQLGSFPSQNVLTSISSTGRYVLVGSQNDDLSTAVGGSLSLVDRDVSGSGTLDTSGNTSTVKLFGANGIYQLGNDAIDKASLFNPGISPDGSMIAFEAYEPTGRVSNGLCRSSISELRY